MTTLLTNYGCAVVYREDVGYQREALCLIDVSYILQYMESVTNGRISPETVDYLAPEMILKVTTNFLNSRLATIGEVESSELRIKRLHVAFGDKTNASPVLKPRRGRPRKLQTRENKRNQLDSREDGVAFLPWNDREIKTDPAGTKKRYRYRQREKTVTHGRGKETATHSRRKESTVIKDETKETSVPTPICLYHNITTVTKEEDGFQSDSAVEESLPTQNKEAAMIMPGLLDLDHATQIKDCDEELKSPTDYSIQNNHLPVSIGEQTPTTADSPKNADVPVDSPQISAFPDSCQTVTDVERRIQVHGYRTRSVSRVDRYQTVAHVINCQTVTCMDGRETLTDQRQVAISEDADMSLTEASVVGNEIKSDQGRQSHQKPKKTKRVVKANRVNKCSVCFKELRSKKSLLQHMRIHTGEKPFQCEICGMGFARRTGLTEHLKKHSGIRPFKCSTCDKSFFSNFRLKLHMNSHTVERPYICEICGKGFHRNDGLWRHTLSVHTKDKPHVCSLCGKGFAQRSHMQTHFSRHEEQRSSWYQCEICDKRFPIKDNFEIHNRGHTGEKPYVCAQCGKGFTSSSYLWQHRKIHDTTSYQCVKCGKSYSWAHTLQQHMKTCLQNEPDTC